MPKFVDLTGNVYGRLTVIGKSGHRGKIITWECRCECGRVLPVMRGNLVGGKTKSCGCARADTIKAKLAKPKSEHRRANPLYLTWIGIKARTMNQKDPQYANYGGRGIKVYPQWQSDFLAFEEWINTNLGPRPDGRTLDRIDNDGNYEPGNLQWSTPTEQNKNRRKIREMQIEIDRLKARIQELES